MPTDKDRTDRDSERKYKKKNRYDIEHKLSSVVLCLQRNRLRDMELQLRHPSYFFLQT